jgi:hypothetical protein
MKAGMAHDAGAILPLLQKLSEAGCLLAANDGERIAAPEAPQLTNDDVEAICSVDLSKDDALTFWQGLSDYRINISNIGRCAHVMEEYIFIIWQSTDIARQTNTLAL